MAHHFARRGPVATVEGGLAAASLTGGKINLASDVLKHLDRGRGNVVVKRIAQTRRHKLDTALDAGQFSFCGAQLERG